MNLVTAFVACLLILGTQGQPASKSNKCKCYSYIGRISPKLIKAEPMIHYPSIFCPHTEIIVTTKADMKKCVNPESPLGRHILKKSQQAREERSCKHQDCLSEYCCNLNKTLHDVHAALLRHSRSDTWC